VAGRAVGFSMVRATLWLGVAMEAEDHNSTGEPLSQSEARLWHECLALAQETNPAARVWVWLSSATQIVEGGGREGQIKAEVLVQRPGRREMLANRVADTTEQALEALRDWLKEASG
jgi:hypothetical protein